MVSCSHQDEVNEKRHKQGSIHQKKLKSLKSMNTLSSFGFRSNDDSTREQVCELCYVAVGTYLKYKDCMLITFFCPFFKLFYLQTGERSHYESVS